MAAPSSLLVGGAVFLFFMRRSSATAGSPTESVATFLPSPSSDLPDCRPRLDCHPSRGFLLGLTPQID